MKAPKESDLYPQIIQFLALHKIWAFRLNSGTVKTAHGSWVRLAPKGSSDIVGIINRPGTQWHGRWLCVECKLTSRQKATPAQAAWLAGMEESGAVVVLCSDVKGLEAALRERGVIG